MPPYERRAMAHAALQHKGVGRIIALSFAPWFRAEEKLCVEESRRLMEEWRFCS